MMNNNFNNNGTNNNSNNNSNNGGKFIMANNTINSLEVFADIIKEAFSATYPDAMVRVHEVKKNNGLVLTGLSICKKGTNLAPTIYLDGFFKQYRMGRAVADIIKEIDNIYRQHSVDVNFEEASVTEFSRVKDKICFKLVNKERNKELLADAPYVDFFDLAVVFYILVAEDAEGTASIIVHNNRMKVWGNPDVMELYMLAKANTQRYFNGHVYNMMSVIESIMGNNEELDADVRDCFYEMDSVYQDDFCPMYVATNSKKLNGACVLLYDGLLREFADRIGKSFFILPSSIHEVILIPDTFDMDINYMKAMVQEVNGTEVSPEEVLSDSVYRYDIDTDHIEMM